MVVDVGYVEVCDDGGEGFFGFVGFVEYIYVFLFVICCDDFVVVVFENIVKGFYDEWVVIYD